MSGSKFLFELAGVSKSYGSHTALERTELRIPAGKTTALIGESGSGKSTLLRLMLGLVQPDTGQVRFDGAELAPQNLLALRRRMGYGIQGGGLFPHLTAGGNVSLMARYLRWPQGRIDERLAELVELTQFPKDGLDRFPHDLSGGQAQRVSLMRALMLGPEALLLDEPLGALDPVTRYELQADLKAVFEKLGKTVVLVTHDIGEAAFFGHLLAVLRRGRIVQQGTIEELVRSPADPYVTRFIRAQRHPMESVSPQAR